MFEDLTDDNLVMYAIKNYNSPNCLMSEFESDLKRTKYLKRLFRRYKLTKSLKERLILNHIILLYNVFGPEATVRILFLKVDESDYDVLKAFLNYLNLLPKTIDIRGEIISTDFIPIDNHVVEILKKI